jgi:hypothetical protein
MTVVMVGGLFLKTRARGGGIRMFLEFLLNHHNRHCRWHVAPVTVHEVLGKYFFHSSPAPLHPVHRHDQELYF